MGKVSWALYANQQNTSVLLDRYQYPFPMTSDMRDKIVTRTCQMFPMYGCKTIVRNQCPVWNIQLRNDLCSNKLIYSWHREFEDLLGFFLDKKKMGHGNFGMKISVMLETVTNVLHLWNPWRYWDHFGIALIVIWSISVIKMF